MSESMFYLTRSMAGAPIPFGPVRFCSAPPCRGLRLLAAGPPIPRSPVAAAADGVGPQFTMQMNRFFCLLFLFVCLHFFEKEAADFFFRLSATFRLSWCWTWDGPRSFLPDQFASTLMRWCFEIRTSHAHWTHWLGCSGLRPIDDDVKRSLCR